MFDIVHDNENAIHVAANDNFSNCDNIGMLAFEEGVYFTQGRYGEAFFFLFHFESFQGYNFTGPLILGSIDNAVGALFDAI